MSKEQALEEKCLLSGWCLVENTTNQDWNDIELSLVAGMPVSFIYNFYRPIFIDRPRIEPPRVLSARPTEIEEEMETFSYEKYKREEREKEIYKERREKVAKKKHRQNNNVPKYIG